MTGVKIREVSLYHRGKKYKRGVLNFDGRCCICGERINKAMGDICHGCNGGHDIHNYPQAVSSLRKKNRHERGPQRGNQRAEGMEEGFERF